MPRTLTFDKGFRLFQRALSLNGNRTGVTCAEIDLSGRCQAPRTVEFVGRRERFMKKHHEVQPNAFDPTTWESVSVIMHCKCRACPACLKQKRIHWYFRAKFETSVAPRTWFGTLTYAPDEILKREILAQRTCIKKGLDWDGFLDDMKFKHVLDACGSDLTKLVKTLRKRSQAPLRYIIVSERHKSGLPHFHMLVHEAGRTPITHRHLKGDPSKRGAKGRKKLLSIPAWPHGFSSFKLADKNAPGYVAKYISKDVSARVRCSEHYGDSSAFSVSLSLPEIAQSNFGPQATRREK